MTLRMKLKIKQRGKNLTGLITLKWGTMLSSQTSKDIKKSKGQRIKRRNA